MSIFIEDGELIVGNQSSKLRAAPVFPEYAVTWILNELDEFDKRPGDAHLAVNFEKLLQEGINAYLTLIDHKQAELDVAEKEDLEKDEKRRDELRTISANCARIAVRPPESFYQALQLTYFVQLVLQIESNGHSVSLGRVDQYLYPFYKKDRDAGLLSDEFAVDLLENTWLKLLSINKIRSWSHTRYSAGSPLYQNVTIGGQTPDGKDAANELSYLILHSVGNMKLTQPNLSIRYHRNMSDDFYDGSGQDH